MNKNKVIDKSCYILSCVLLAFFLFGCREKGSKITVFDNLPESQYLNEVKQAVESNKPLAITFTAEWCPHCRKYKPTFFEVKDLFEGEVTFINVDVNDQDGSVLSSRFQVKGIPTTAFVRRDGSVYKVQVGGIDKDDLTNITEELIKSKKRKRGEPLAPFPIEPQETKTEDKEVEPQELIKEEEAEAQKAQEKEIEQKEIDGRPSGGRPEEIIQEQEDLPLEDGSTE